MPNVKKSGVLTYPDPLGPSRRPVVGETFTFTFIYIYIYIYIYTGCPGRNVPDFGRMFLKLKYTDITKNTYIRTVTEIIAKRKVWSSCGSTYFTWFA